MAAVRTKKYYRNYELRLKAKMQRKRTREEQVYIVGMGLLSVMYCRCSVKLWKKGLNCRGTELEICNDLLKRNVVKKLKSMLNN